MPKAKHFKAAAFVQSQLGHHGATVKFIKTDYGISDTGLSGIWFFMFYDAMFYLVMHTRKRVPE